MAPKLSVQEKKDLDRFTKFFVLKSAQVIVDSRLGNKITTQCKTTSEWFNLAVPDLPEVLAEAKKAYNEDCVLTKLPLCVEISLRTVEGDQMVLESWCLGILPDIYEYNSPFTQSVYNRMGILLKSLVSVTRVTPAYKLSRRQGPDSYIILYRIYVGEPVSHALGDGYKVVRVGQLCTPIGTLHLTVLYRTKMTISPTTSGRDNSIMLKSDHFNTNLSPRHGRCKQSDEKNTSLEDGMKVGAFAVPMKQKIEAEVTIPETPFRSLLFTRRDTSSAQKESSSDNPAVENEEQNGNSPAESHTSDLTMMSTNDDFIMKTPFASKNVNAELGMFYREWQTAPPLQAFTNIPTLAEQVQDLTKQLENFESDMNKYDDMLLSLCHSPNNN
ncbi:autophagy-related protein 13 homolog isoform X2 [Photinus pyralis]|uniref:autophagy-related protein 13 homolog isoform X2 n=1 Tax=Photinus pyralis TaxID=7054 RepID=UPI0012678085|nr:autophagy-related protein 13 homolog isoform X2 [Photinus pyralis]